jgi:hypothetical protein
MGRELIVRVRFEPTRNAKEKLRVAYELISPVRRATPGIPTRETRESPPEMRQGTYPMEKVS